MLQDQAMKDVASLLRARNTLLWITSTEEKRVEGALIAVAENLGSKIKFWDCADGITDAANKPVDKTLTDVVEALDFVKNASEKTIFVFRDLHKWFADPMALRKVRSLQRELQGLPVSKARSIIVLTPSGEIPPELKNQVKVIDWPLPDREEIGKLLDSIMERQGEDVEQLDDKREAAIDAAVGLTAQGAADSFYRSLVTEKRIDPSIVHFEKKQVIAASGTGLTWVDPDPRGLDAVGGLDELKSWLVERELVFTAEAREYGLPEPKGIFLLGPPGTGKSLTAKTVATAWGIPLLRMDPGALKSKFVGESEANARNAMRVAKSVAPVVLWIDEIDKAMAGSEGPQGDGGVSSDFLGAFLSWLQDGSGGVFVVATANDTKGLSDALLRKGRFDQLWFVDLPTPTERRQVLAASLAKRGRDPEKILGGRNRKVTEEILTRTDQFSGAEIDAAVPEAMFRSFAERREVTAKDILTAVNEAQQSIVAKTSAESIGRLRDWAKVNTRSASSEEKASGDPADRELDLDVA